ncbi:sigma-70 family RNA polymerase sigma factor [Alicyclobacillus sp. TC]|uniref:sigma-70 family RNA polymerase sigma factor n=1 Tax=Alicyclobacillus sp. TC TaxID=2606450 RepID=UPI001AFB2B9A|nr:sigma-70 family RNA polymerase sigma factor [Alicyclobacillus sp. TC]
MEPRRPHSQCRECRRRRVYPTIPDLLADHSNREMEWFSGLSEREKTILYGLYWEGKNQRELSRQIGISQTTISHIHRQAIRKLKEQIQNEG